MLSELFAANTTSGVVGVNVNVRIAAVFLFVFHLLAFFLFHAVFHFLSNFFNFLGILGLERGHQGVQNAVRFLAHVNTPI